VHSVCLLFDKLSQLLVEFRYLSWPGGVVTVVSMVG